MGSFDVVCWENLDAKDVKSPEFVGKQTINAHWTVILIMSGMDIPAILTRSSSHRAILWHASDAESASFTYAQVLVATFLVRNVLDEMRPRQDAEIVQDCADFIGVLFGHEPAIVPVLLG